MHFTVILILLYRCSFAAVRRLRHLPLETVSIRTARHRINDEHIQHKLHKVTIYPAAMIRAYGYSYGCRINNLWLSIGQRRQRKSGHSTSLTEANIVCQRSD